jgi:2-aminoadipate transaminase
MTIQYNLKAGYPNGQLVPRERLSQITAEVLRSGRGWQYGGDLMGSFALREQMAQFLGAQSGTGITPNDLMITSGALTGIDILCRALTRPGDVIAVEDPTFFFVVQVLRMSHVEIVGVPLGDEGIDLDGLQALADKYGKRFRLVYAIPSFQNPTGITATDANRAALAEMARKNDFYVIEDSTYQMLYYDAPPPPYLKTYDDSDHIITVGSMSKLIMPALRSGWIWAKAEQVKSFADWKDDAGSALTSEMVADYIRLGEFADQVEHARNLYAHKHDHVVELLDRHAPDWLDWSAPGGGFFIWATLPDGLTASMVEPLARERGVSFMPGRDCYVQPPDDQHMRLCFAMLEDEALEQGIVRLCDALHEAEKRA